MTSFYHARKLIEERIKNLKHLIWVFEAYKPIDGGSIEEDIKRYETELKELKIALNILKGAETKMTNIERFKNLITPEFVASGWLDNVEDVFCTFVSGTLEPSCEDCPLREEADCDNFKFRMDYLNAEYEEDENES